MTDERMRQWEHLRMMANAAQSTARETYEFVEQLALAETQDTSHRSHTSQTLAAPASPADGQATELRAQLRAAADTQRKLAALIEGTQTIPANVVALIDELGRMLLPEE